MIVHVANPIYDSVFKYIMEDERIAKTVLSALLKKEVVHVTVRPHEYANTTRNAISMFRIDFAATVVEDDGSEQVILIELQKTWLNTETLRFRQYLGVQYGNQCNIQVDFQGRLCLSDGCRLSVGTPRREHRHPRALRQPQNIRLRGR